MYFLERGLVIFVWVGVGVEGGRMFIWGLMLVIEMAMCWSVALLE